MGLCKRESRGPADNNSSGELLVLRIRIFRRPPTTQVKMLLAESKTIIHAQARFRMTPTINRVAHVAHLLRHLPQHRIERDEHLCSHVTSFIYIAVASRRAPIHEHSRHLGAQIVVGHRRRSIRASSRKTVSESQATIK